MPKAKVKLPEPDVKTSICRICSLLNRDKIGKPIPTKHVGKQLHTFAPDFSITQIVGAYLKRKGH
jgi:hypothetical protein